MERLRDTTAGLPVDGAQRAVPGSSAARVSGRAQRARRYLLSQLPTIGIVCALMLLAGAGSRAFIDAQRMADTLADVREARDTIDRLNRIALNTERTVSVVRIFILVGAENILAPLGEAERQIDEDFSALIPVLADEPELSAKVASLHALVSQRLADTQEYVRLRRELGLMDVTDAIPAGGEKLANEIRELMDEIVGAQRIRLEAQEDYAEANHAETQMAMVESGIASVFSLVVGFVAFRTQSRFRRLAEQRLSLSEARLRAAQHMARIGTCYRDLRSEELWCSNEMRAMLGMDLTAEPIRLEQLAERVHPNDRDGFREYTNTASVSPICDGIDVRFEMPNGLSKTLHILAEVKLDAGGRPIESHFTLQDITDRVRTEAALRESEERYATTVELAGLGICHVAPNGRFLWVNPRLCDMLGYSERDLLGMSTADISHPEDIGLPAGTFERLQTGELTSFDVEKRYIRKDGETVWVRLMVTMKRGEDGTPLYAVSFVEDISQRRHAETRVKYLASHDDMTGLPNRVTFGEMLKHAIKSADRHGYQCAVLFIDLDRFKDINDTMGHQAGDELLRVIGRRLQDTLRESDTAARLGGDEFCILAEEIADSADAAVVADKCLRAIAQPVTIMGRRLEPRASIGITLFPTDGRDCETLLQNADSAMYAAKKSGSHQYAFYTRRLTVEAARRLTLEHDLRRSVALGEFVLHYQPQVSLRSGKLCSLEALVRWNHPERGLVQPGDFIDVAERIGLIEDLGEWVLAAACREAVRWNESADRPVGVAVNISSQHLGQGRIVPAVAETLAATGLDPGLLELEVTESSLQTSEENIATLRRLRKLGVKVAIDDFGTGYAWLDSLRQLPINTLKTDRRFLVDVVDNPDNAAILATIVAMARTMRLTLVTEGVETFDEVQFLHALGCDLTQGFFFSRPVAADAVFELLGRDFRPGRRLEHLTDLGGLTRAGDARNVR